jgi:hypothetical protein
MLEMLGVVTFLAFEGRIDIAVVKRFLARFDDERLAPSLDMVWCSWEDAIALLGFRDFVPRVEAAWKDGRTPDGFSEPKYFFRDLKRAEMQWSDPQPVQGRTSPRLHRGYRRRTRMDRLA